MKKIFAVFVFSTTALVGWAQGFDDLAFPNPDRMTYFQQEMTSLMRFQAKYNLNVPFFVSFSGRVASMRYKPEYLHSLYDGYDSSYVSMDFSDESQFNSDMNGIVGVQFKVNNSLYIPVLFSFGQTAAYSYLDEYESIYNDTVYKTPMEVREDNQGCFAGSGVFINTDIIKGGIYLGAALFESSYNYMKPPNWSGAPDWEDRPYTQAAFKIALAPLINTSQWAYVGKVLNNVLGYLGTGNNIVSYTEEEGDSKAKAFATALNAALDLTFNRMHLGPLALDSQAIYTRGNFDASAKNDIYGLKLTGLFPGKPFGFTLEGGYKHFYAVSKFFTEDYPDTGYFNGSIFFPFKKITLGLMYGYDRIYESKFTIALSTNFFSGFGGLNNRTYDSNKFSDSIGIDWGLRFRWNGWKAGKE